MFRKSLLISILFISGCAFNDSPKIELNVSSKEPLNIEIPSKPSFEQSKDIEWKLDGDRIYTDIDSFKLFLNDLVDHSKYTNKIEEVLKKYQEYIDTPNTD